MKVENPKNGRSVRVRINDYSFAVQVAAQPSAFNLSRRTPGPRWRAMLAPSGCRLGALLPDGDVWPRANDAPRRGDNRYVRVYHPFAAVTDEPFWLLFVPGFCGPGGWADEPETIASSAFVLCRLMKVIKPEESCAWIVVGVDDVVMMAEIERRFRVDALPQAEWHQTMTRTSFEGWELLEGSSEGDIGIWFLARCEEQKLHLLAAGRWSFHEDTVRAGNLEISSEQCEHLAEGMRPR